MKVILASSSPRRLDLLHQLGWEAEVFPMPFDEVKTVVEAEVVGAGVKAKTVTDTERNLPATSTEASTDGSAKALAETTLEMSGKNNRLIFTEKELALLKNYRGTEAVPAYNALGKAKATACVTGDAKPVIGADTVVLVREEILGKPQSEADAKKMLRILSGKTHLVKTAVAIFYQGKPACGQ